MIHQIKMQIANVYLIRGEKTILVDTGAPNSHKTILRELGKMGLAPTDIDLILLTHAHGDHAGSAAELKRITGAPLAVHEADADMLRRGENDPLTSTRLTARLLKPIVDLSFEGTEADWLLTDNLRLDDYGVPGTVITTPGHTNGSVSIVMDNGEAIIGDVMMGGSMGGALFPTVPRVHYFYTNRTDLDNSMRRILSLPVTTLYVGHGGPLNAEAARSRFRDVLAAASLVGAV
jgi:hydroxyacylglutathione hydrolase